MTTEHTEAGTEQSAPGTEGQQATQETSWRDSLPETLRDAPFFKGANDLGDAVNQLSNAASHMGNSIRIPSADASEEDQQVYTQKVLEKFPNLMPKPDEGSMDQFYNSMGRPTTPDEYRVDLGEGRELPEDLAAFRQAAHEAGLTQAQFEKVLKDVVDPVFANREAAEHEHRESMKALAQEWGYAFDGNINAVKNFLDLTDAPQGIRDLLENDAMTPEEIKWIHSIAKQTGSPTELAQQRGKADPEITPQEAQNQIQDILNNSDHPYFNPADPRNKAAIAKMVELHRLAIPPKR